MIISFENQSTEDIFNGVSSHIARRVCPQAIRKVTIRKLEQLDSVTVLDDLRVPPGNRLEALSGSRSNEFSNRINQQYQICFKWTDAGPYEVDITDYH